MFLGYYGLREQPFGVTPDPRYLYFTPPHREALGSLFYGIETGRGFLALIAPPGLGKTTLLARLLDRLRNSAQTAFLFHTQCDSRDFVSQLLTDLGVEERSERMSDMYETLHCVLLGNARSRKRVVLIIDEAQNLADSVFETVRLLSDFETAHAKLIQIVLCGQPQLAERLAHPGLIQLRQRISIIAKLLPLTPAETRDYINYRLKVAGHVGDALFEPGAVEEITLHSGGIPRKINNICFNALTLGHVKRQSQIDASIVREAVADLDLDALYSRIQLPPSGFDSLPSGLPIYGGSPEAIQAAMWGGETKRFLDETFPQAALPDGEGIRGALPSATRTSAAATYARAAVHEEVSLPSVKSVSSPLQSKQTQTRADEAPPAIKAVRTVSENEYPIGCRTNNQAAEQEMPSPQQFNLAAPGEQRQSAFRKLPERQLPAREATDGEGRLGLTEVLAAFYCASHSARLVGDFPSMPNDSVGTTKGNLGPQIESS